MDKKEKYIGNTADFLKEAVGIADEIVALATKDASGWRWINHDHKGNENYGVTLYSGSSGTLYFLIEIYKVTKDPKYLEAITGGLDWLMGQTYGNHEKNLALYCGLGGIIYVMMEGYKVTGSSGYKEFACQLTRQCNQPSTNSDILYGSAGCIQTLLYLHNEIQEDWVLQIIESKIEELFAGTYFPAIGACWERGGHEVRSLCGFAHGASGIAFVFFELYRYFGNEVFLRMGEMAFEYEDRYFEEKGANGRIYNWPDFRKDTYTDESLQKLISAYSAGNFNELIVPTFMSAWCHGAPGIGMARLHAYNVTKAKKHYKYFRYALRTTAATISDQNRNFTFCHGVLGNANLLIDAYAVTRDTASFHLAKKAGEYALKHKSESRLFVSGVSKTGAEADSDILNGKAGIGHYFLRLARPDTTPSPLAPKLMEINGENLPLGKFDKAYLLSLLFRKTLPNSYLQLGEQFLVDAYRSQKVTRDSVIKTIKKFAESGGSTFVKNAFSMDNLRVKLSDGISSNNYHYIRNIVEQRKVAGVLSGKDRITDLLKTELLLRDDVTLMEHQYPNHKQYSLYHISTSGEPVAQCIVSEYFFNLLRTYLGKSSVDQSFRTMIKKYYSSDQSALNFGAAYRAELKEAMLKGLILLA